MQVMGKHYRTVWMEDDKVFLIEQNKLPFKFEIFSSNDYHKTCAAIKNMLVRGAGAIGTTAGFAMAQAFLQAPKNNWENFVQNAKKEIESTRPTAQNLFYATDKVYNAAINSPTPIQAAQAAAQNISDEDIAACEKIGELGNTLINNSANILTHCNAGWLAFTDFGSALSPIYKADASGKDVFVYVDETRPRSQGARLTAWELQQQNIAHKIIPDNAAAYFMQNIQPFIKAKGIILWDNNYHFESRNKLFTPHINLRTFMINSDNRVVLFGNPLIHSDILHEYKKKLVSLNK